MDLKTSRTNFTTTYREEAASERFGRLEYLARVPGGETELCTERAEKWALKPGSLYRETNLHKVWL